MSTIYNNKTCSKCRLEKALTEFCVQPRGKFGRHSICKSCFNKHQRASYYANHEAQRTYFKEKERKRKYAARGLTVADYERMVAEQCGVCAICKHPSERRLALDHDHKTNKARGLLCNACNSAIGYLREDPRNFFSAIDYLVKHGAPAMLPSIGET